MDARLFAELGFSDNRRAVYLALLDLGECAAAAVARRAGLKRTTVYELLEGLVADGLAHEGRRGSRRSFSPADPRALHGLLRRREKALGELLPLLLARGAGASAKPRLQYFAGLEGVRRVNEMLLEGGVREYRYFGSVREMVDLLGESWLRQFVRRRVALGIRSRAIRARSREVAGLPWMKEGARYLREVRTLPRPAVGELASLYLLPDRILVSAGRKECYGMVVESRDLAGILGLLWDSIWATLPAKPGAPPRPTA